jgi:hypothetical protein
MNLQEQINRIRQIMENANPENTFSFTTEGGEAHQYQVEIVTDSTKSIPVDKTNPRGEKKTYNTKVITMKWLNPPSNLPNAEGLTIVKVCGDNNIKAPRGYSQLPDDFINYANKLC